VHEKEIQYFAEAFQLANDKFYIDAIHQFNKLVAEFPDSDLSDDALLNIGLCYYSMSQFEKSIESLNHVIQLYPDATISTLNVSSLFSLSGS
jgi:TolA-binding protein